MDSGSTDGDATALELGVAASASSVACRRRLRRRSGATRSAEHGNLPETQRPHRPCAS